jgi:hypothetical protein
VTLNANVGGAGSGTVTIAKSTRLSSVSWPDPDDPPGRRSRLPPAAGAG